MRCPVCGVKYGTVPFVGPVCVHCYELKVKCPDAVVMEQCKHCGRVRIRGEWREWDEDAIKAWVMSKCKGEDEPVDYDLESGRMTFVVEGVEKYKDVKLVVKHVTCPTCSRKLGGYFEAVVQIRGQRKNVERWKRNFIALVNKKTFVTKVVDNKHGVDVYVGDGKVVLEVITQLGVRWKASKKLHGVKDGRRVYRTTYAVRV
jgi:nonsense-mediated mRNA decay protein 3